MLIKYQNWHRIPVDAHQAVNDLLVKVKTCHQSQVSWVNMPPAQGPALSDAFYVIHAKDNILSGNMRRRQVNMRRHTTNPLLGIFYYTYKI